jgi:hypothetical protein
MPTIKELLAAYLAAVNQLLNDEAAGKDQATITADTTAVFTAYTGVATYLAANGPGYVQKDDQTVTVLWPVETYGLAQFLAKDFQVLE